MPCEKDVKLKLLWSPNEDILNKLMAAFLQLSLYDKLNLKKWFLYFISFKAYHEI